MTPTEKAHDAAVHHRIALGRYSTSVVRKVVAQLNRVERDVLARLARADNERPTGQRLERLLAEIRALQSAGWGVIKARVVDDLTSLAQTETTFTEGLMKSAAPSTIGIDLLNPGPPVGQVMAAVTARPFQGRLLREWLDGMEAGAAQRVRETIRQGLIEGQTTDEIVRTLRGTRAAQFKDGVLEISRRGAEAMVRTAITHTANVAAQATYEANADIVTNWRFVATLDNRTTLICASLHGRTFDIGKGPQPPRHINCRSTTIPVVGPIEGLAPMEFPSYEIWLRSQSADVQDDILGPTRARLFRAGGLKVDRFVDDKGRVLSLEQLKAKNAEAFAHVEKAAKRSSAPGPFTTADLDALKVYTGPEYVEINSYLRGANPGSNYLKAQVEALDVAIGKSRLKDDVLVYRGVGPDAIEHLPELRYGAVIEDQAFLSTSRQLEEGQKFARGGLLMAIRARKGQVGVDVSEVSSLGTGEREILFARGSRLRVVEWDHVNRTLHLERLDD